MHCTHNTSLGEPCMDQSDKHVLCVATTQLGAEVTVWHDKCKLHVDVDESKLDVTATQTWKEIFARTYILVTGQFKIVDIQHHYHCLP